MIVKELLTIVDEWETVRLWDNVCHCELDNKSVENCKQNYTPIYVKRRNKHIVLDNKFMSREIDFISPDGTISILAGGFDVFLK